MTRSTRSDLRGDALDDAAEREAMACERRLAHERLWMGLDCIRTRRLRLYGPDARTTGARGAKGGGRLRGEGL